MLCGKVNAMEEWKGKMEGRMKRTNEKRRDNSECI
jgi:hypothetical protein